MPVLEYIAREKFQKRRGVPGAISVGSGLLAGGLMALVSINPGHWINGHGDPEFVWLATMATLFSFLLVGIVSGTIGLLWPGSFRSLAIVGLILNAVILMFVAMI